MKIFIGNTDRTAELGPALNAEAACALANPRHVQLPPELLATSLRGCRDEREFLDRLLELVRRKSHVDTIRFDIPRKPGFVGSAMAAVRKFLWRALRYQHDPATMVGEPIDDPGDLYPTVALLVRMAGEIGRAHV